MREATKFTPGPWKRNRFGECRGANNRSVNVWDAGIGYSSRCEETEANARLIVSAPELYAALEEIVSVPASLDTATVPPGGVAEEHPDRAVVNMSVAWARILKARAALAKARGEA